MALLTKGDFKGHFIITAYLCWISAAPRGGGVGGVVQMRMRVGAWSWKHAICKHLAVKLCRVLYSITPAEFCIRKDHPSNCTLGIRRINLGFNSHRSYSSFQHFRNSTGKGQKYTANKVLQESGALLNLQKIPRESERDKPV